jgi:hypothetical protein
MYDALPNQNDSFFDVIKSWKCTLIEFCTVTQQQACNDIQCLLHTVGDPVYKLFDKVEMLYRKAMPGVSQCDISAMMANSVLSALSSTWDEDSFGLLLREQQHCKPSKCYEKVKSMALRLDSSRSAFKTPFPNSHGDDSNENLSPELYDDNKSVDLQLDSVTENDFVSCSVSIVKENFSSQKLSKSKKRRLRLYRRLMLVDINSASSKSLSNNSSISVKDPKSNEHYLANDARVNLCASDKVPSLSCRTFCKPRGTRLREEGKRLKCLPVC